LSLPGRLKSNATEKHLTKVKWASRVVPRMIAT